VLVSLLALVAAGIVAWRLGARLVGSAQGGIVALLALHATFAMMVAKPWLYIWDYLDVLVFMLFVEAVAVGRSWRYVACLAAIGILNHEIALFIAGWLVIDPIARWGLGKSGRIAAAPLERMPVLVGALVAVVGVFAIEQLRSALLVEQIGPKIFREAVPDEGSLHFTLGVNVEWLGQFVSEWNWSLPWLIPLFLLVVIAMLIRIARRDPARYLGLSITFGLLLASLLLFGILIEVRIYLVLVPVVVLAAVLPRPVS
jgi:hypothetical protein